MRFTLPADKKLVHESRIPIRWADMDSMGHVNNALYFRYLEIVRLDWLHSVGASTNPQGSGPVVVNAFCNFLRQLEYPGELRALFFVAAPGRSSFDSYTTLERVDEPGQVYAEGGATIVWTDYRARRSTPLPDTLRARLG